VEVLQRSDVPPLPHATLLEAAASASTHQAASLVGL
jgi:hypothetical protein